MKIIMLIVWSILLSTFLHEVVGLNDVAWFVACGFGGFVSGIIFGALEKR